MPWKNVKLRGKVIVGFLALALLVGMDASVHGEPQAPTPEHLVIPGSGDSQAMLRAIAKRFMRKRPDINVVIPQSTGTSGGVKALRNGKATLSRGARKPSEAEQQAGVRFHLFAWSPVVIAANIQGGCSQGVTYGQLVDIYSGKSRDYADLGCGEGKIYPIMREEGDSSLRILRARVPGFKEVESPLGPVYYTTGEAVEAVATHRNTLGYFPLTSITHTGLTILPVDGFMPSSENIQKGLYSLVLPLTIFYLAPPRAAEAAFIDFLYTPEAAGIILQFGGIPASRQAQ